MVRDTVKVLLMLGIPAVIIGYLLTREKPEKKDPRDPHQWDVPPAPPGTELPSGGTALQDPIFPPDWVDPGDHSAAQYITVQNTPPSLPTPIKRAFTRLI